MAALIYVPIRWLAMLSVAVIALHNCLDRFLPSQFGSAGWVWNLIHEPGVIALAGRQVLVTYTLLPWIGVMAAGFCFGKVFTLESTVRQRIMLRIGLSATVTFLVIRAINLYGDPAPWSVQRSAVFTVLSFLNCTKYPASLDFLLMTLGPAILFLAYLDRCSRRAANPPANFGYSLWMVYILWCVTVVSLYPICKWFAKVKATRHNWWSGYL